jgi:hypothetical protein
MIEGELRALFMADPVVTGHTGEEVAKNIVDVGLDKFEISAPMYKEQFTGLAFDGQYFSLGVPEWICNMKLVDIQWILPGWDGAHRLELALGDLRKDAEASVALPTVAWYAELATTISNLQL